MTTKSYIFGSILLGFAVLSVIFLLDQQSSSQLRQKLIRKQDKKIAIDHDEAIFPDYLQFSQIDQIPSPIEATLDHERALLKQHKPGKFAPIRVLVDYSNVEIKSDSISYIEEKLIPGAIAFIKDTISVYPVDQISEIVRRRRCLDAKIPKIHQDQPIKGSDLVIYVTIVSTSKQQNQIEAETWIAKAAPCILSVMTGRPVAGSLMINKDIYEGLFFKDKTLQSSYVPSILHELMHLLAFNPTLFNFYVNPKTNIYLGIDKVIKTVSGKTYIILPTVVKTVRKYFKCESVIGGLLENDGGINIEGTHWERAAFGTEAMTGTIIANSAFSVITLSLLEGSGWYSPNYDLAQPYSYGQNGGCDVSNGKCPQGILGENCFSGLPAKILTCGYDYLGLGQCNNEDPLAGDQCYINQDYKNLLCDKPSLLLTSVFAVKTGGALGTTSRCFTTPLGLLGGLGTASACYKASCGLDNTQVTVTVFEQSYKCLVDLQVIVLNLNMGFITCPNIARFCSYSFCPNDCSGVGDCKAGACKCWKGYSGPDCSEQLPALP